MNIIFRSDKQDFAFVPKDIASYMIAYGNEFGFNRTGQTSNIKVAKSTIAKHGTQFRVELVAANGDTMLSAPTNRWVAKKLWFESVAAFNCEQWNHSAKGIFKIN